MQCFAFFALSKCNFQRCNLCRLHPDHLKPFGYHSPFSLTPADAFPLYAVPPNAFFKTHIVLPVSSSAVDTLLLPKLIVPF